MEHQNPLIKEKCGSLIVNNGFTLHMSASIVKENKRKKVMMKHVRPKLIHRVGQSRESGRERVGEEDGELQ